MKQAALPVTVAISRRPRPGREAELAVWARQIARAAATFPGHLGAAIHAPEPPQRPELTIVFSFATAQTLAAWESSAERARHLALAEELTDGPQRAHALSGLEGLFAGPARPAAAAPRWKTAVVIGLALYPLSMLVSWLLAARLGGLPLPLRSLVTTAAMVPLMVWVAVPVVSRALQTWLRPAG